MNRFRTPERTILPAATALISATLAVSACSSSGSSKSHSGSTRAGASVSTSSSAGAPAQGAPTGTLVHVKNFAFNPGSVTVPVGGKVTWEFDDSISHNVSASDKTFSSNDLNNGATFTFTFPKAGTYQYLCTIHPSMKATVVVR